MRFCLKSFFYVFAVLFLLCFGISFADEANTWNTDFSFELGEKEFQFMLSGWETKTIPFYLTNNSDATISGSFDVVDATGLAAWLGVCMANWQNEEFGQYWIFEQTGFSLAWNSIFSGSVTLKFPEWYSGEYLWCITYTPSVTEDTGSVNPQPRKALFLRAVLSATATLYRLKVFPWSRSKSSLANIWEIRFYDENNELVYSKDNIISDSWWNAEFLALIPDGVYTVVYKWQSHLASFMYGISVIAGITSGFDFTVWNSLSWVQNYTSISDNGSKYQIAWDLKSIEGKYDFTVNWNDVTIVTVSWFVDYVDDLDPRDLNWDNVINVADLAIIWTNFQKEDIFFLGNMYGWKR